jgi:single-strand DNA-binding protein
MLIIGKITKDAVVAQLKDERQVVNFSVALNDYYKPKNGEGKRFTTFINCSYWISTRIAERLIKGALVEISGRIYSNAYIDMKGDAKSSISCHANMITIHQQPKENLKEQAVAAGPVILEPADDLPF